jgi:PAS domain S-box-containing protein
MRAGLTLLAQVAAKDNSPRRYGFALPRLTTDHKNEFRGNTQHRLITEVHVDKEFYLGLLDQISDGVYFVARDRHITYWNGGAERITGFRAEEVQGHSCSEGMLRHIDDTGGQLCLRGCPLAAVMRDGEPREARVYLHHKDGHRVPVTVRGSALRNPRAR